MQGPDNLIQNPLQKNLPIFMRIQNICIPSTYIVLVYHHVCIQIDVYIQPTKEINIRNEGRVNCNKRQMSKSLAYIISLYYIKLHIYSLYILSILNCKVLVIVLDNLKLYLYTKTHAVLSNFYLFVEKFKKSLFSRNQGE